MQAINAVKAILAQGPKKIVSQTSAKSDKIPTDLKCYLLTKKVLAHRSLTLHTFAKDPVGVGDLTAGLFMNLLNGKSDIEAFEHTANAVNEVCK